MYYRIISSGAHILADEQFMLENYGLGNYELLISENGLAPVPPEPEPEPVPSPIWQWYIDIGPFYDRFGTQKMAVLTSTDAGIRAILADLNIRKWVDLQRPDVAQALAYVGSVIPSVDSTLQSNILNTPVQEIENLALRKLYFS